MIYYEISMQHSRKSFELLSRMQYDLFCKTNRVIRSLLSIAAVLLGLVHSSEWWSILVIAYGCYLGTSTYTSPTHTAHRLAEQVEKSGLGYPKSRFLFYQDNVLIAPIPDNKASQTTISYADLCGLGEDLQYFYLFRDRFGGYMIPKEPLGEAADDFRSFIESRTNQRFQSRSAPVIRLLNRLFKNR